MKSRTALYLWPAVLALAAAVSVQAALAAGAFAYTKRFKTALLAEPSPLAKSAGELPFARKVKVEEVKGNWLRVSDGPAAGWVFLGSLSELKPDEGKGLDGAPLLASNTTATAAARPLTPAANEYSQRRNLGNASEDLSWLLTECGKITSDQVETYMKEHKKGEYQ